MRVWAQAIGALAAISLIAATTVGCASTGSHPGTPAAHASPTAPSLIPPSPASTFAPSAAAAGTAANRQAADQTAAAIVAAYVPPPGARTASSGPAAMAGETAGSLTDWVEHTAWWVLSGSQASAQRLLRAEVAKALPDPDPGSGDIVTSGIDASGLWGADEDVFIVGSPSFYGEQLGAEVGPSGNGKTVLRVDAIVSYLPGRTAAETIAGAGSVVVTAYVGQKQRPYIGPVPGETRTVTDRSEVSKLAAVVNSRPTESDEPRSCPNDIGVSRGLWLDFRPDRAGGTDYRIDIDPGACGDTTVTAGGVLQPTLATAPTGQILRFLGVTWNLATTPPADPAP
jgi:hypothetical protein